MIEGFYVATELAMPRVFCRDRMFLCCDKVGNGGEALCRDIIFYVVTECGQMERFCVAIEQFYFATELAKAMRNHVSIELVRVGRISVAT